MLLLQDACLSNENMERKVAQRDLENNPMHFENNDKNTPLDYVEFCEIQIHFWGTTWSVYVTWSVLTYRLLISVQHNVLNVRL